MIKPVNDKVYTNEHPKVDRVEPESVKVARYQPGKKTKTLKELLGKDFDFTGPIKILPGETIEGAIKRLLKEQKKKGN
jgi:hypothetical protein